jgi:hypothetical protein
MHRVGSIVMLVTSVMLVASSLAAVAQGGGTTVQLPPQTTLPIVFTNTVSAERAHAGDPVLAKTLQAIELPNGMTLRAGTRVVGHVVDSSAFVYDKTPYARQKNSTLTVHFDAVTADGEQIPLNVSVRAIANVFATTAAEEPVASDMDPLGTLTLVGGEYLIPSQREVRNMDGDVVAYNKHGGVYAHLIQNGRCDGNSTEVSMGIFSATACGAYGYGDVSEFGSQANPSTLTLTSFRSSPVLWKHSTALLEVLPQEQASVLR